jgi:hypothetical protein
MPRVRHVDTPDYAVDVIDGARPIGSQLAVAGALLSVLLVAMTSVEAPLAPHAPYSGGQAKIERPANGTARQLVVADAREDAQCPM